MSTPEGDSQAPCPYCGGDDLVEGRIAGHHRTRFRPTGKKWWRAGALLRATACLGCGGVWIRVARADVEYALGRAP